MTENSELRIVRQMLEALRPDDFLSVLRAGFFSLTDVDGYRFQIVSEAEYFGDDPWSNPFEICFDCGKLLHSPIEECWSVTSDDEDENHLCTNCAGDRYLTDFAGLSGGAIIQLIRALNLAGQGSLNSNQQENQARYLVDSLIDAGDLPIKRPSIPWNKLRFDLGPIPSYITADGLDVYFGFLVGELSSQAEFSDLVSSLASEFQFPGLRLSFSGRSQSELLAVVTFSLQQGESARVLLAVLYDVVDVIVQILQRLIDTKTLIAPTNDQLAKYGLMAPGSAYSDVESHLWRDRLAGSKLLFARNDTLG